MARSHAVRCRLGHRSSSSTGTPTGDSLTANAHFSTQEEQLSCRRASWTPDRYEIRDCPEGDIIAAIYDTRPSDWQPFFAMRPDPENTEKRLLTNQKDQTLSAVFEEARKQQQRASNFLNARFQETENRDGACHQFNIEDRARRGPEGQVQHIAAAWRNLQGGWQSDFTTKEIYSQEAADQQIYDLNRDLNLRPSTSAAEGFAARYLREHPYPQA